MIVKNNCKDIEIINLLSLATNEKKAKDVLDNYLSALDRVLYVKYNDRVVVGCIGLDLSQKNYLTITHLAVRTAYQGKKMPVK